MIVVSVIIVIVLIVFIIAVILVQKHRSTKRKRLENSLLSKNEDKVSFVSLKQITICLIYPKSSS